MKIISKYVDYYDGVARHGVDPTLVYLRKTTVQQARPKSWFAWRKKHEDERSAFEKAFDPLWNLRKSAPAPMWQRKGLAIFDSAQGVSRVLVAFCGRAYVIYHCDAWGEDGYTERFCAHPNAVLAFSIATQAEPSRYTNMVPKDKMVEVRSRREPFDVGNYYESRQLQPFNDYGWKKWLDATDFEVPAELHRLVGAPVFLLAKSWPGSSSQSALVVNPCLRDIGFASIVDPYTAHQSVAQYLGNELAQQKDGDEGIGDLDRAAMKGHGGKYSFRKAPKGSASRKGTRKG